MKTTFTSTAALAAVFLFSGCARNAAPVADASVTSAATAVSAANTFATIVDSAGAIARPTDFATGPGWTHIGSWAVVNENGEGNGLHDVYTTRDVVAAYRDTGEFPDGAVLVKEVRGLNSAALTTGKAHWAADEAVWFVSVKDRKGRFPGNPLWGDGWGWALFKADEPAKQAATDYKKDCLGCHTPAAASDLMYVYGYPSLGAKAAGFAPQAGLVPASMTTTQEASMGDAGDAGASQIADAAAGEAYFMATCAACHSAAPGENRIGPSLAGVVGRAAGSAPGFAYSNAMKSAARTWTAETLDAFLADVKGAVPGNQMAILFPAGVKDPATRAQVIAYLQSISG